MFNLWRRSRDLFSWLRQRREGWLGIIVESLRQATNAESSLTAAAMAYFALFSFFPLIVLTMVIAGTWFDFVSDKSAIIDQLDFVAPALAYLLGDNLRRITGLEGTLTSISAISLLWSASNIFYVLTRALDRVWGVLGKRSVWRHRGLALLSVLVLSGVLLLATVVYTTLVTFLSVVAPTELEPLGAPVSQLAALLVSILLFAVLYRYLPHAELSWADIWPGAIAGGLLWEVVKRLFFFYATHYMFQPNLTQLIYASAITTIAFLAWSYVSSLVFLFGAYVNVGCWERRKQVVRVKQT